MRKRPKVWLNAILLFFILLGVYLINFQLWEGLSLKIKGETKSLKISAKYVSPAVGWVSGPIGKKYMLLSEVLIANAWQPLMIEVAPSDWENIKTDSYQIVSYDPARPRFATLKNFK